MNRGYAVDFGRWCGSNGNRDGRDFANSANGASVKTSRHKLPGLPTARGASPTRPPWPLLCRMPTLPSSGFRPWSCGLSLIRRTAVCGPACTVVWQGRRGDPSPYADSASVSGTGDYTHQPGQRGPPPGPQGCCPFSIEFGNLLQQTIESRSQLRYAHRCAYKIIECSEDGAPQELAADSVFFDNRNQ